MPQKIGRFTLTKITNIATTSHARHSIAPGDARTFANPTCSASTKLVNLYSNYVCDFVLLCLVAVVSMRFLPAIYRRGVNMGPAPYFTLFSIFFIFRQLTPRDASPWVCLPHSLFDLIDVPLSLLLHFYFAVWRTRCPYPCLPLWVVLHCLYVAFLALRVLYVVVLGLF